MKNEHRQKFFQRSTGDTKKRLVIAQFFLYAIGATVIGRLFILMVLQHGFYTELAAGSQEMYAKLFPRRGQILISDIHGTESVVAINKDVYLLYVDTREIKNDATAQQVLDALTPVFHYDDTRKAAVLTLLNRRTDAYRPLEQRVEPDLVDILKPQKLPGVHFVRQDRRFYPEGSLAAQVIGFVGKDTAGNDIGHYGIEGYWNKELTGQNGFLEGARSARGSWIPLAGRSFNPAKDGADIVLTLDRTIQYKACEALRAGLVEYGATSAALVIEDPQTGAILAMCSVPDFNPNDYGRVSNPEVYNNATVFTAYEPGSIFKPIAMSAALNENVVTPDTPFFDTGHRDGLCQRPIQNAGNKSHGAQTMTGVLLNSINTGMVFVAEHLGKPKFMEYIKKYGFGLKTAIELDTEVGGTIDSITSHKGDRLDCYTATASFGQGITVTPLQMANAFSAIANGGRLLKPYIVKEIRYPDGRTERTHQQEIATVLSHRASSLLTGMLVKTVDNGYSGRARVPGYYVAGKSGTAEIAGPGGYTKTYNHSFIGYAPAENPKYVMIVKYEKPQRAYAESTAAPVFGALSKFLLEYLQVPPTRQ